MTTPAVKMDPAVSFWLITGAAMVLLLIVAGAYFGGKKPLSKKV